MEEKELYEQIAEMLGKKLSKPEKNEIEHMLDMAPAEDVLESVKISLKYTGKVNLRYAMAIVTHNTERGLPIKSDENDEKESDRYNELIMIMEGVFGRELQIEEKNIIEGWVVHNVEMKDIIIAYGQMMKYCTNKSFRYMAKVIENTYV